MLTLSLFLLISSAGSAQDVATNAAEYMDATARVNHFSGNVLMAQNGKTVFVHSYAMADREKGLPNSVNTKLNCVLVSPIRASSSSVGVWGTSTRRNG